MNPFLIPGVIGQPGEGCKYTLHSERPIGSGAFGQIYLVHDQYETVFVAKYMFLDHLSHDNPENILRAENEIRVMKKLNHFACVGLVDTIHVPETKTTVLILEYMNGGDLTNQIFQRSRQHSYFGNDHVTIILLQLVLGLHHMHSNKMLHRDIKSSNVLVSTDGLVKIGDFGLSNVYETLNAACGQTVCGTPFYLPPEQWLKQRYGKAADIWELGVLMYELIELRLPYQGDTLDQLQVSVCNTQHSPITHGPAEVAELVNWMLQKDPSQRPTTDQLLRSNVMANTLKAFHQLIASSALPPEKKEIVLRSLDEVSEYISHDPPPQPVVNTSIRKEGWVKKFKANSLEDRYYVLCDGMIELLNRQESTRGKAARPVSSLLDVQEIPASGAFVTTTNEGTQQWFCTPDASDWVRALRQALGLDH